MARWARSCARTIGCTPPSATRALGRNPFAQPCACCLILAIRCMSGGGRMARASITTRIVGRSAPSVTLARLGRPAREVWDEIWEIIGPQIEQVMSGRGATWNENQLVPITRNGRREDVYWTYSYGPIDDEAAPNGIGGVLVVCTETTQQVLAEQRLAAQAERQRRLFERAPGFIAVLSGPEHVLSLSTKPMCGSSTVATYPAGPCERPCLKSADRGSLSFLIRFTRLVSATWQSMCPWAFGDLTAGCRSARSTSSMNR